MSEMKYTDWYLNNSNVNQYDIRTGNKFEKFIFELEKHFLIDAINFGNINEYLDFGCGTGRIIKFISENYFLKECYGMDSSKYMIEEAKKRVPNAKFIVKNILKEKYKKKFDIITTFRLILNLEDELRLKILKELRELIYDNGILIINNHNNRYSFIGMVSYVLHKYFGYSIKGRKKTKEKTIKNTLTEKEMKNLLKEAGFKVIWIYRFAFLPMMILPERIQYNLELFISKTPLRYFSKDQIYVCEKI